VRDAEPSRDGIPVVWIRGGCLLPAPSLPKPKRPALLKVLGLRRTPLSASSRRCFRGRQKRKKKSNAAMRAAPARAPMVIPAIAPLDRPLLVSTGTARGAWASEGGIAVAIGTYVTT